MVIGFGVFGIFAVVGIGSLVLSIMTAVSASKYPDWAFQQSASSKFVWVGVPIILLFFCSIAGGVMGLIWFTSKRDEVERAARSGSPYGYGAPQPGYGAPQQGYGAPTQSGWGPPPAPSYPPPAPTANPPSAPQGYPPPWTPPQAPPTTPQYPPSRFPPPGEGPPPPAAPQQ